MTGPAGRRTREQREFERLHWPGSDVYRNKLGIRAAVELERAERLLTSLRAEQGFPPEASPNDYAGLRAIHRHLFQDLYDWAGEERRYTTGRGAASFALPEFIGPWMETQFEHLRNRRYLIGTTPEEFAAEAGPLVNEINAAHPFVDGNGRAQRHWLRALAAQAEFDLTFLSEDRIHWNDASRIGFEASDHQPMIDLLRARMRVRAKPEDRD